MGVRSVASWLLTIALLACGSAVFSGEGPVALQTADAMCVPEWFVVGRFFDCGNGTVFDRGTGLLWLADANCFGLMDWHQAMETISGLGDLECAPGEGECDCGLSDGSSPGEWRLPSRDEWMKMTEAAEGCIPTILRDSGLGCWDQQCVDAGDCSFYGVQLPSYWSSSSYVPIPTSAWSVGLGRGTLDDLDKGSAKYVWPVRGGQ